MTAHDRRHVVATGGSPTSWPQATDRDRDSIAILGVAGLTVAAVVALSDDGKSRSAGATSTSATVEPAIDPCLVGQWRLATGTNGLTEPEGTYVISGGSGTLRNVEADGTERFDFSDAAPYTGTAASGPVTVVYRGTALGGLSSVRWNRYRKCGLHRYRRDAHHRRDHPGSDDRLHLRGTWHLLVHEDDLDRSQCR